MLGGVGNNGKIASLSAGVPSLWGRDYLFKRVLIIKFYYHGNSSIKHPIMEYQSEIK